MSKQTWQETIATAETDGPTLTAAAAASCLPVSAVKTLGPDIWSIGKQIEIIAAGKLSTVITTPGTLRFDVRLGGTVVFDGLAMLPDTVAAHTNVGWYLKILLTCRAVGNGTLTTFMGHGVFTCEDLLGVPATAPKGVLSAILPWNSAPAIGSGIDNTIGNKLDLFFTQTVATGSLTLQQYSARILN